MKKLKYIFGCLLLLTLVATSCYKDKGSYNYTNWTSIASVEGILIPGSNYGRVTITEGDLLAITPTITFNPNVNPADFEYEWFMGGKSIGKEVNLSWEISPVGIEFLSEEAFFFLKITNKKTGESWKYYATDKSGSSSYMVKVKISASAIPLIGVMIYEKSDGSIEWGSIKGTDIKTPEKFTTVFSDMYARYNPGKKIQGPFVGASFDINQLTIYTKNTENYGVMIQTTTSQNYPLGNFMGFVKTNCFPNGLGAELKATNWELNLKQELLIGEKLFLAPATKGDYPYQIVQPADKGIQQEIAQIISAKPYTRNVPVSLQRTINGDLYYYYYSDVKGYSRSALPSSTGTTLNTDEIVGLFREPTGQLQSEQELKFFVVTRKASTFTLYVYTIKQLSSGNHQIKYVSEIDVSSWSGTMNSDVQWFTTATPVGGNYAYFVKGAELWRFSYEGLRNPTLVKTYENPITVVQTVTNGTLMASNDNEYYTMIFTYNSTAKTSLMHAVDLRSATVDEKLDTPSSIPGKVLEYKPYYTN